MLKGALRLTSIQPWVLSILCSSACNGILALWLLATRWLKETVARISPTISGNRNYRCYASREVPRSGTT